MEENGMGKIGYAPLADRFLFPALVTGDDFTLLYRNRAAQKLLPAPWRLKRFLKSLGKEKDGGAVMCAQLEGIDYFVYISPPKDAERLLLFSESLVPLCEPFSKSLFGESLEVLEEIAKAPPALTGQGEAPRNFRLEEKVISRTYRLRSAMGMYRHFLLVSGRKMRLPTVCSIEGLFRALAERLTEPRVRFTYECCQDVAALVSPDAFTFVILNVIRFLYVYQGVENVSAQVKETETGVEISFEFADREKVFSALARLFQYEEKGDFPKDLCLAPLFSALVLCREHKMKMDLQCQAGQGKILLNLASATMVPTAFLGTKNVAEQLLLDQWLREIFFFEENKV